jgi:ribosomal protein L7/L12
MKTIPLDRFSQEGSNRSKRSFDEYLEKAMEQERRIYREAIDIICRSDETQMRKLLGEIAKRNPGILIDATISGLFKVVLTDKGERKIHVIKVVKDATGLGLKEAKDVVESAPHVIQEKLTEQAARKLVENLKEEGATAYMEVMKQYEENRHGRYGIQEIREGRTTR